MKTAELPHSQLSVFIWCGPCLGELQWCLGKIKGAALLVCRVPIKYYYCLRCNYCSFSNHSDVFAIISLYYFSSKSSMLLGLLIFWFVDQSYVHPFSSCAKKSINEMWEVWVIAKIKMFMKSFSRTLHWEYTSTWHSSQSGLDKLTILRFWACCSCMHCVIFLTITGRIGEHDIFIFYCFWHGKPSRSLQQFGNRTCGFFVGSTAPTRYQGNLLD